MNSTRRALLVAAVSGPLAVPLAARTQDKYPSKPIRLIVPFPPGGGVDLTARLLMEPLAKELGQSIIVENKGGAGGLIGIEAMARSAPDGYTLAVTGVSSMSAGPHLRGDKLPFDPIAFAHITRLVRMPLILAVRNDLPARTLPDFMTLAHSTEIRWASGGIGTSQHLGGELFVQMSGLKMIHVPYRGTGPALNDLAGGVVDAYFGDPATLGIIKSGKARAMAVTSGERWAVLPDTPTLGEAVPGYEAWNWYGLDAPPKTPEPIVDRLAEAVRNVMDDPAVRKKYDDSGLHPATLSRSDYVSFIKRDSEVWGKVIRTGNIKPDD